MNADLGGLGHVDFCAYPGSATTHSAKKKAAQTPPVSQPRPDLWQYETAAPPIAALYQAVEKMVDLERQGKHIAVH